MKMSMAQIIYDGIASIILLASGLLLSRLEIGTIFLICLGVSSSAKPINISLIREFEIIIFLPGREHHAALFIMKALSWHYLMKARSVSFHIREQSAREDFAKVASPCKIL